MPLNWWKRREKCKVSKRRRQIEHIYVYAHVKLMILCISIQIHIYTHTYIHKVRLQQKVWNLKTNQLKRHKQMYRPMIVIMYASGLKATLDWGFEVSRAFQFQLFFFFLAYCAKFLYFVRHPTYHTFVYKYKFMYSY